MIPVSPNEILPRFTKLHFAITCEKIHLGKAGSLFCTIGIPPCQEDMFPCNRFSQPKWDEKVI